MAFYRKKWEGAKVGRINLYSIIQTDASNSPLYKVALAYLKQLYGDYMSTNKNDPARIQKVFDEVLRIQKTLLRQGKDPFELFEIKLKDPRLNAVFYKMLKGTNLYDLETNKGYLPLELAIEFSESANAPINFNYANISLLKALFGEKTTSQIITLEIENQKKSKKMRNSYAITENQIFDILFGKGFNNEISNKESLSQKSLNTYALSKNQVNNLSSKQPTTNLVLSLLNYRNIDGSPPVSWTDPKTNITVRLD